MEHEQQLEFPLSIAHAKINCALTRAPPFFRIVHRGGGGSRLFAKKEVFRMFWNRTLILSMMHQLLHAHSETMTPKSVGLALTRPARMGCDQLRPCGRMMPTAKFRVNVIHIHPESSTDLAFLTCNARKLRHGIGLAG
jgi:hypothetical protein